MAISFLDKQSATYKNHRLEINQLAYAIHQAFPGDAGESMRKHVDNALAGQRILCDEIDAIARVLQEAKAESLAQAVKKLQGKIRVQVEHGVDVNLAKKLSLELKDIKTAGTAERNITRIFEILRSHDIDAVVVAQCLNMLGYCRGLQLKKEELDFLLERLCQFAESMNSQNVANSLNALPKLGIRECPLKLLERLAAVALSMNGQNVENSLHALPKLGIRECPSELLERLAAVARSMNEQHVANSLNALPKLGVRKCPLKLLERLCTEAILGELNFKPQYRDQVISDLLTFSNVQAWVESRLESERSPVILEFLGTFLKAA